MLEIVRAREYSIVSIGRRSHRCAHAKAAFAAAHYGKCGPDTCPCRPAVLRRSTPNRILRRLHHPRHGARPGATSKSWHRPADISTATSGARRRCALAPSAGIVHHLRAIAALPDGAGNITPNARFSNFLWVEPRGALGRAAREIPSCSRRSSVDEECLFRPKKEQNLETRSARLRQSGSPIAKMIDARMREALRLRIHTSPTPHM